MPRYKIAVCFYGQVRLLESLNIMFPYVESLYKEFKFDYFISTWDDFDSTKLTLEFKKKEFLSHEALSKDWGGGNTRRMAYLLSRVGILKKQYELENDFSYDIILMIRPDVAFDYSHLYAALKNFISLSHDRPTVSCTHRHYLDKDRGFRIDEDWIFLLTSDAFDIHTSLYNFFFLLKKYKLTGRNFYEGGHWIHIFYFLYNNFKIEVNKIDTILIRPTRDIDTVKKYCTTETFFKVLIKNVKSWKVDTKNQTFTHPGTNLEFKGRIL